MSPTEITIVIPAFNQVEFTRQCIASILVNTDYPFRVILVDNGSDPPLAEFFTDMPAVTVLRSDTNLGFAAGVNLGMKRAPGHVVILNNDTLMPIGWLTRMVSTLTASPDIGAVGPMTNCVSGSQLVPDLTLGSLDEINDYAASRRNASDIEIRDVARLVGFCMLVRKEVIDDIGYFDEQFATGNFEDDDYCVRILRAGYRLCVDEGSFVFHYGSQTFQAMGLVGPAWQSLIAQNEARFGSKWDLRPEDRLDSFQASLQHNRRAALRLEAGDPAGAIRIYVEAIQMEPHLAQNHNDLAVVLWQHGETEKAFARIKRALTLDPNSDDARSNFSAMAEALDCRAEGESFLAKLEKKERA